MPIGQSGRVPNKRGHVAARGSYPRAGLVEQVGSHTIHHHDGHFTVNGYDHAYEACKPTDDGRIGQHNCIPIRRWFRARWICVRCDRIFKADVR